MIRSLLLATALLTLPVPALADVTAHYKAGKGTLTVEVDDAGNARADFAGKFTAIHKDGADYVVVTMGGAAVVIRIDDLLALARAKLADAKAKANSPVHMNMPTGVTLIEGGVETAAGYAGTDWMLHAGEGKPLPPVGPVVISTDPRLAPIGNWLHGTVKPILALIDTAAGPQADEFTALIDSLLAKGTIIRAGKSFALDSVDTGKIDPHHFDLPGTPLSADALKAMLDKMMPMGPHPAATKDGANAPAPVPESAPAPKP